MPAKALILRLKLSEVKVTLGTAVDAWSSAVEQFLSASAWPTDYRWWIYTTGHSAGWVCVDSDQHGKYGEESRDEDKVRLYNELDAFMTANGFERKISGTRFEYEPEHPDETPEVES